ncbi:hypothetical protein GCM10022205_04630 [Spinactinospora alkalitolerans]
MTVRRRGRDCPAESTWRVGEIAWKRRAREHRRPETDMGSIHAGIPDGGRGGRTADPRARRPEAGRSGFGDSNPMSVL